MSTAKHLSPSPVGARISASSWITATQTHNRASSAAGSSCSRWSRRFLGEYIRGAFFAAINAIPHPRKFARARKHPLSLTSHGARVRNEYRGDKREEPSRLVAGQQQTFRGAVSDQGESCLSESGSSDAVSDAAARLRSARDQLLAGSPEVNALLDDALGLIHRHAADQLFERLVEAFEDDEPLRRAVVNGIMRRILVQGARGRGH